MSEFLSDPSVLTKDKLKSALVANNVALPNGDQRKGVYVELYLKNLTSQNKKTAATDAAAFSSDEELPAPVVVSNKSRSGRKATRKTDRVRPEEVDVTELTNEGLKDQLLKYGVNAGPIVASTRKVYEKKLQKFLDLGPPEAIVPEPTRTDNSQNGNADSDQYSDKEEETTTAVPEPEPEPEPVPVVERPLRSRGKTPVTTRTRSGQHKTTDEEDQEEDFQGLNVRRKSRRWSHVLDQTVPASDDTDVSELSAAEMLAAPQERKRAGSSAAPEEPKALPVGKPSSRSSGGEVDLRDSSKYSVTPACVVLYDVQEVISTGKLHEKVRLPQKNWSPRHAPSSPYQPSRKLGEKGAVPSAAPAGDSQSSLPDTAVLQVGSSTHKAPGSRSVKSGSVAPSREAKAATLPMRTEPSRRPHRAPALPSEDLIHMMCRLSPPPARRDSASSPPPSLMDSLCRMDPDGPLPVIKSASKDSPGSPASLLRGKQTKLRPFLSPVTPVREQDSSAGDRTPLSIEKLSAVEHTPKTAERDVLKELFPNETLNTPTGMSATRRAPIRGAAGRPFSDAWRDELRPRLTELRQTTSSYTESRSISRSSATPVSSVPLSSVPLSSVPLTSIPKPSAPPSVQVKTRRRLPVWVQLLLLSAVAGFLFFVYQAMETNEISPFAQPESSGVVKGTSK